MKYVKKYLIPFFCNYKLLFLIVDLALVTYIFLNLDVNFEKKILSGYVDLTVIKIDKNVNEIVSTT